MELTKANKNAIARLLRHENRDICYADCLTIVEEAAHRTMLRDDVRSAYKYVMTVADRMVKNQRRSSSKREKREANYTQHHQNVVTKKDHDMITVDVHIGSDTAFRDFQFRDDIENLPSVPRAIVIVFLDHADKIGVVGTDNKEVILGKLRKYLLSNGVVKNLHQYYHYMHYLRNFLQSLNS